MRLRLNLTDSKQEKESRVHCVTSSPTILSLHLQVMMIDHHCCCFDCWMRAQVRLHSRIRATGCLQPLVLT